MLASHRWSPLVSAASTLAWTMLLASASLAPSGIAAAQPAADIRLARYTTASGRPEAAQADPLQAVVQLTFPRTTVSTVGDAMAYLLLRTGYRLAPRQGPDPQEAALLSLPLPEVHRQLGPYTVHTALSVLLGEPYELQTDPRERTVTYRAEDSPVEPVRPAGEVAATTPTVVPSGGAR